MAGLDRPFTSFCHEDADAGLRRAEAASAPQAGRSPGTTSEMAYAAAFGKRYSLN